MTPIDWQRLKQRKLVQWAIAYLAGAWLLLQFLSLLAQPFAWPDLVLKAATVLLGIGFFAALVVAWYHSEKGAQRVSGPELLMLIALLVIAGAGVALVGRDRLPASPNATTSMHDSLTAPTDEASIAVLPFANLSADPANEYFSDGITETLLNALSQIPGLRVPARTSTFAFKRRNVDVRQIGRELGVAHVLEGSVQKADRRLRITVQLINVADGYHLWSQIYNRELEDVFAIQDEISRAIVAALEIRLAAGSKAAVNPTNVGTADIAAYEAYLKGRYFFNRRSGDALRRAIRFFEQAVARDSTFAMAYSGLADSYTVIPLYSPNPPSDALERGKTAALKAVQHGPEWGETHTSLAYNYFRRWEFANAGQEFERAISLNPKYAPVRHWYAEYLVTIQKFDEAIDQARLARRLDPISMIAIFDAAWTYYRTRRYEDAVTTLGQGIELDSTFEPNYRLLATVYRQLGRYDDAMAAYKRVVALGAGPTDLLRAELATMVGDTIPGATLARQLEADRQKSPRDLLALVHIHNALGHTERAVQVFQMLLRTRSYPPTVAADPDLDPVRADPRIRRMLKDMGVELKSP